MGFRTITMTGRRSVEIFADDRQGQAGEIDQSMFTIY
jgi:hypothetical protein